MDKRIILAGLGVFAAFMGGCGTEQAQPVEPFDGAQGRPVCLPDTQVGAVVASAEDVLGRMNFTIDKADAKGGYVRTLPLTGAQAFEFWRKDNVGQFNTSEANLQTVRRTVEINVGEKNGQVCADCTATVERMSLPEREAVSTTHASALFTRSAPSLQRLELNPEQREGMTWIGLGRDSRLEAEILRQLRARL